MLNHQHHLHAVGNFQYQYLLDVVNLVGLQNLDELNLDVARTCPDEVHLLHQLDEQVDVELRHQLRTDYFPDAVGVELRQLLRMDYFPGEVLA
jgi:REP element-mobilizing transposase RayT